jgi:hypothetical protein
MNSFQFSYGADEDPADDDNTDLDEPGWEESHEEWLENPRILFSMAGDADWIPGRYQVPGSQVPKPLGYHRARAHEITKPVLQFASQVLKIANPDKLPQNKVIGKRIPGVIDNMAVIAQIEWHLDNHPPRPELGLGPMEGDPFYHMGISLYLPNDSNVGFGWFGSKLAKGVGHFISNVVKTAGHEVGHVLSPIQKLEGKISKGIKKVPVIGGPLHSLLDVTFKLGMAPTNLVISIAEGDRRIDQAVLNNLKEELKEFKEVAPYAEMVVSLVPGVGQGVAAAMAAGIALAEGQPIAEALEAGLIAAVPGGPLVQAAVSTGVSAIQHIAQGQKLDLNMLSHTAAGAASAALGLPPASNNALVAGITITGGIAKGEPLDKSLADAAVSALPISDTSKRAMAEASTIALELAHGHGITPAQSARIAALAAGLPPTNPLRDSIQTSLGMITKDVGNAQHIMQAALHSGLADTLVSMGAEPLAKDVKNAIKTGTALGTATIYQVQRAAGLDRAHGKLVESGIQQSKHHPVFGEARKLAGVAKPAAPRPGTPGGPPVNTTRGFDLANGLLQHQVGVFDVMHTRNRLDPAQRHGFDMAAAARIGAVGNPQPPGLSPAAHAGYAISYGMRSHGPDEKMALMQSIQQNPSAAVGATVAVKEIATEDSDNWFVRLLRALGLHK